MPLTCFFLVGPGGTGKSSVGPLLAMRLGARFVDLDQQVCERVASIPELVARKGYRGYCEVNAEVAHQIVAEAAGTLVMATSSGFLAHDGQPDIVERNTSLVRRTGRSVLPLPDAVLAISADVIARRQAGRYPADTYSRWHEITAGRLPLYRAAADVEVTGAGDPESVAAAIALRLSAPVVIGSGGTIRRSPSRQG